MKNNNFQLASFHDTLINLNQHQYLAQAYLVGGGLRDLLLGRLICDFDLTLPGARQKSQKISNDKQIRLVKLSEKQGQSCYRIIIIVQAGCDECSSAVSQIKKYRQESKVWFDLTELYHGDIYQDLELRDFTINAMALPFSTLVTYLGSDMKVEMLFEKVIDPHNGLKDLKSGNLRAVSNRVFIDDPARLWRLWRLAAELQFKPDTSLTKMVSEYSHLCRSVSGERVHEELYSLLIQPESAPYIKQAVIYGLLEKQFPVLSSLRNCSQGVYNKDDVFTHSLAVLVALENVIKNLDHYLHDSKQRIIVEDWLADTNNLFVLKLSALFHDVGKPLVRIEGREGVVHFYGHEKVALPIIEDLATQLKLSNREKGLLLFMVKRHLQIHDVIIKATKQTKMRFWRKHRIDVIGLTLLGMADYLSKNSTQVDLKRKKEFLERHIPAFIDLWLHKVKIFLQAKPLLDGQDIKNYFMINEGPLVGIIKKAVWEAQQNERITTRREAIILANRIYEQYIDSDFNID